MAIKDYSQGDKEHDILRKYLQNQAAMLRGDETLSITGGGVDATANVDWTGQHTFTKSPEVAITDIGAFSTNYALVVNKHYQGTIAANRTVTFSGSPAEGSTISLKLLATAEVTLTVPSSKPLGAANTATTSVAIKPTGNHFLVWKYVDSEWVLSHTADGDWDQSENTTVDVEDGLSADGKYTGVAIDGTAGATLAFGDVVVLDVDDSRWEKADVSVAAAATGDVRGAVGFCVLAAAADGDPTKILLVGTIRADANFPDLTAGIGKMVYATTSGDITLTQPTTTDHVIRVLGYALTADSIIVQPASSYTTHT